MHVNRKKKNAEITIWRRNKNFRIKSEQNIYRTLCRNQSEFKFFEFDRVRSIMKLELNFGGRERLKLEIDRELEVGQGI